jgi:hypothetical protein
VNGRAIVQQLGESAGPDAVDLAADVRFHALTPAIGVDGQGASQAGPTSSTSASVGKGHLEQAGRWTGTLSIGDEVLELAQARGNRDKSWGPRSWRRPPRLGVARWPSNERVGVAASYRGRQRRLDAESRAPDSRRQGGPQSRSGRTPAAGRLPTETGLGRGHGRQRRAGAMDL